MTLIRRGGNLIRGSGGALCNNPDCCCSLTWCVDGNIIENPPAVIYARLLNVGTCCAPESYYGWTEIPWWYTLSAQVGYQLGVYPVESSCLCIDAIIWTIVINCSGQIDLRFSLGCLYELGEATGDFQATVATPVAFSLVQLDFLQEIHSGVLASTCSYAAATAEIKIA